MPRHVLLPTDGSPLSNAALDHAVATYPGGTITLVHVVAPRYATPEDDALSAHAVRR